MKKRIAITALLTALMILLAGCSLRGLRDSTELRVTYIDVGKGDCILLEKDGTRLLIDTGYSDTVEDVSAYLEERGVSSLDVMIVTHYDKDHAGGAPAIAQAFPVKHLYLPGYEGGKYYTALMQAVARLSVTYDQVRKDVSFELGGVDYEIYASGVAYVADGSKEPNDNDVSLVVSARYGADSYLFAGDLEKEGIASFLRQDRGKFDVVKMPHHGDNKENTNDFLKAVTPEIAVITDSPESPAEEKTLSRLVASGAKVYRTATQGTVIVSGTGVGEYKVTTFDVSTIRNKVSGTDAQE